MTLALVADDLTIVGPPVVGAVRMVNAASVSYEIISNIYLQDCFEKEKETIKRKLKSKIINEVRSTKEYPNGQEVINIKLPSDANTLLKLTRE